MMKETNEMAKANLAVIEGTKGKPLSSAEAEAGLEATQAEIATALDTGDMAAFVAAQDRVRFYTMALERAQQREAEAAAAGKRAELEALRPEAEAAALAAARHVALAPLLDAIDAGVAAIVSSAVAMPEMLADLAKANTRAVELCQRAGIAFVPVSAHPEHVNGFIAERIREAVVRELRKVSAHKGVAYLPPINFII